MRMFRKVITCSTVWQFFVAPELKSYLCSHLRPYEAVNIGKLSQSMIAFKRPAIAVRFRQHEAIIVYANNIETNDSKYTHNVWPKSVNCCDFCNTVFLSKSVKSFSLKAILIAAWLASNDASLVSAKKVDKQTNFHSRKTSERCVMKKNQK